MTEKHYAFLKNNRVENILVFESEDEQLAINIAREHGYDKYMWLGEDPVPVRWSTWNSTVNDFIPPTQEYLISIGVMTPAPEVTE